VPVTARRAVTGLPDIRAPPSPSIAPRPV